MYVVCIFWCRDGWEWCREVGKYVETPGLASLQKTNHVSTKNKPCLYKKTVKIIMYIGVNNYQLNNIFLVEGCFLFNFSILKLGCSLISCLYKFSASLTWVLEVISANFSEGKPC